MIKLASYLIQLSEHLTPTVIMVKDNEVAKRVSNFDSLQYKHTFTLTKTIKSFKMPVPKVIGAGGNKVFNDSIDDGLDIIFSSKTGLIKG